jgi:aerobic-type carbon monoxide dehydrogenase small subunit (CoxS/CutS family)
MVKLVVNGRHVDVDAEPDKPLLWVLRDDLGLTGTKLQRACVLPVGACANRAVVTIEGLATNVHGEITLHAVQQAWLAENVPQCGYCQAGQIMTTVALLAANPHPSDDDIDSALSANLCRCGTYPRIRRAVHRAAAMSKP